MAETYLTAELLSRGALSGPTQFRAMGSRAKQNVSFGRALSLGQGGRWAQRFPVPFRRIKALFPTFSISGNGLPDVDFPNPFKFTIAVAPTVAPTLKDVPPRTSSFTFSGKNGAGKVGLYDPTEGPFVSCDSDVLDLGAIVSAGTFVDFFSTIEHASSASPGPNTLPWNASIGSTLYANHERFVNFPEGHSPVETDWASVTTDFSALGAKGTLFVPYFVVDCGPGSKSVLIVGDSIGAGVAEGFNGFPADGWKGTPGALGDDRGNAYAESGWCERLLGKLAFDQGNPIGWANLCKASDRAQYFAAPGRAKRRIALAAKLNPTHILWQYGRNDRGTRSAAQMAADAATGVGYLREAVGRKLPWVMGGLLPFSTSAGNWTAADGSDQTVDPHYGPSSDAAAYNAIGRRPEAERGHLAFLDVGASISVGGGDSGLWKGDGTHPKKYTGDGNHPTSDGHELIAADQAARLLMHGNPFMWPH